MSEFKCQANAAETGQGSSPSALQSGDVRKLWDALSDCELAIIAIGIPDLVDGWGEPRHRQELGVKLPTNAGTVYQLYDAFQCANTILNDPDFLERIRGQTEEAEGR